MTCDFKMTLRYYGSKDLVGDREQVYSSIVFAIALITFIVDWTYYFDDSFFLHLSVSPVDAIFSKLMVPGETISSRCCKKYRESLY